MDRLLVMGAWVGTGVGGHNDSTGQPTHNSPTHQCLQVIVTNSIIIQFEKKVLEFFLQHRKPIYCLAAPLVVCILFEASEKAKDEY